MDDSMRYIKIRRCFFGTPVFRILEQDVFDVVKSTQWLTYVLKVPMHIWAMLYKNDIIITQGGKKYKVIEPEF